jgi:hypothetical protein
MRSFECPGGPDCPYANLLDAGPPGGRWTAWRPHSGGWAAGLR